MAEKFDYCVVGAGIVGSAAAYLLAREQKSVALLEQFEFGHQRGSSHGESRITRYTYDFPNYVRMAKRAFPLWDEISKESGEQLYVQTGGLDLDLMGGKGIADCKASLEAEKVPFEMLDRAEIKKRFPQFDLPKDYEGLFQADSGILSAGLCVRTLQNMASKHGAVLQDNAGVSKIESHGKGFSITYADKKILAKNLILAAGGWMGPLLLGWGSRLPLYVTQEQWAFFEAKTPEQFMPDKFPIFIEYGGMGSGGIGWYGFPTFGRSGVKAAFHLIGPKTTADTRDFEIDEQRLSNLHDKMRQFLPTAAGEILSAGTCLYTNSADSHFIIDTLPGHSNAVFFTGCSGHAFKFGPVIAEILIGLLDAKEEYENIDLSMFSASRFSTVKV